MLELKNISKKYSDATVAQLSDVSFSVSENEFVCLVGPSGCGKSTILKMVAGIESATAGNIEAKGKIAMVFQNGALLPWRTVSENIALALESMLLPADKVAEEVKKYLAIMKLEAFADAYPVNLSGGQRQRVGIARALAVVPKILLLDEPFSALDEKTAAELYEDLTQVCKERQLSVLMTSHRTEEVATLADRVLVIGKGKIQKEIPVSIASPRRSHEAEFIKTVNQIREALFVG